MSNSTVHHPLDSMEGTKEVLSFLASVFSQAAHYGFSSDLVADDYRGLSKILDWASEKIAESEALVTEHLAATEIEFMKRYGIPQEAFADGFMRNAWGSGFSAGLSHAEKGTE